MSDFALMDAIECRIHKLPRVPVAENIPGNEMPMFRDLWENIRADMPKKGRGKGEELDPLKLPTRLQTALEALYGHYQKPFRLWEEKGIKVPPCFIVVCQNTAISKLVYDFISGFNRKNDDGTTTLENGRLALFRNFDDVTGNPLPRPNTLLIDSEQLEAGDALDDNFRAMAADEIERFRREIVERTGDIRAGENITDQELLREVMNTVGKPGQLGGASRCVVSVSMLTEGWDANTVTHVLGIRAFGTQLLCGQVIGRPSIFAGCLAGLNREPLSRIGRLRIGYGIDPDKIISPGSNVVRKALAAVQTVGAGKRYLIQHSAGSGKSNSIAWLSHQLIGIERNGKDVFDSVIVVTDRRILDDQIQKTIKQFMQVGATVGHAEHSGDLRKFIEEGKKIIISTVQKFPFILDELAKEAKGKTFAIIIDEAHSSQGGKTSSAMSAALALPAEEKKRKGVGPKRCRSRMALR